MKIVINPKYEFLRDFVTGILQRSYKVDKTYRNFRNIVEETRVGGVHAVVKIFKKPTEFNRVVYSFLRPTKAKRSYEYSIRLLKNGIDVPEPVAYLEKFKGPFFHTGCYICVYTDYSSIADFKDINLSDATQRQRLDCFLTQFSAYVADFHSKGLVHNDFNIDNILYKETDRTLSFQLIDLNRVQFHNRSLQKCAKDFSSIHFPDQMMDVIVDRYCMLRNLDKNIFLKKLARSRGRAKGVTKIKDIVLTPLGLRKKRPADGILKKEN